MGNRSKSFQQAGFGLTLGIVLAFGITVVTARAGRGEPVSPPPETARENNPMKVIKSPMEAEPSEEPEKPVPSPLSPEQQEEIRRLRAEVNDLERTLLGKKTSAEKMRSAKRTYELFLDFFQKNKFGYPLELHGRLSQLEEEAASYFYDRYSEDRPDDEKLVALYLALFCGGPKVAEMMEHHLESDLYLSSRVRDPYFYSFKESTSFPVHKKLADTAYKMSLHTNPKQRDKALLVLSKIHTKKARQRLESLMANDPNKSVRISAIKALGNNGDKNSLRTLNTQLSLLGTGLPDIHTVKNLDSLEAGALGKYMLIEVIKNSIKTIENRISK